MIASRCCCGLQQLFSLAHAVIRNRAVVFKNRILLREVSLLKDDQEEAAVDLLWSEDVVVILPTGFEGSLTYQLYATAREM